MHHGAPFLKSPHERILEVYSWVATLTLTTPGASVTPSFRTPSLVVKFADIQRVYVGVYVTYRLSTNHMSDLKGSSGEFQPAQVNGGGERGEPASFQLDAMVQLPEKRITIDFSPKGGPKDCDEEPDPEPAEVVWLTPPPRDQQEVFQTDPILQMQAPGILGEADLQEKLKHPSILGGTLGGVHDLIEGEVILTINPTNNSCLYITLARGMGFHRAEDQAECLRQRIVRQVISESGEDCNPEEFPNFRNWRVALEDIGYLDTDEFYDNRVQDALLSGTGVSSEGANITELAAFSKICWGSKGYFSVKWCNRDTTLPSQPLRVGGSFDCGFQDAPVIYVLYCYRHVDLLVVNSEDHKRRFT